MLKSSHRNLVSQSILMPNNFDQLLNGNFGDVVLISVYPTMSAKKTSFLVSAHIILEVKVFKSELRTYIKKWFYNPEAFSSNDKMNKLDNFLGATPMELSFSDIPP